MNSLKTTKDGSLVKRDLAHFGGEYSMLEKIKIGGVGSTKLIYESGISSFDKLFRGVEGEIAFVSFELLKNGLILRLNLNQRFSCLGIKISDIQGIDLVGYRIMIKQKRLGIVETKTVHRGELSIISPKGELKFMVLVGEFESIVKYFQRKQFSNKFNFSISTDPPEKDYGYLIGLFDFFK